MKMTVSSGWTLKISTTSSQESKFANIETNLNILSSSILETTELSSSMLLMTACTHFQSLSILNDHAQETQSTIILTLESSLSKLKMALIQRTPIIFNTQLVLKDFMTETFTLKSIIFKEVHMLLLPRLTGVKRAGMPKRHIP